MLSKTWREAVDFSDRRRKYYLSVESPWYVFQSVHSVSVWILTPPPQARYAETSGKISPRITGNCTRSVWRVSKSGVDATTSPANIVQPRS